MREKKKKYASIPLYPPPPLKKKNTLTPAPEGEEEAAGPQTTQRDGDRQRCRRKDRQTLRYKIDGQTSRGDGGQTGTIKKTF